MRKTKLIKYTTTEVHDLLHQKVTGDDYWDKQVTDQALFCPYYIPLSGKLGMDWGVIVNPMSPKFGMLVFEHAPCGCWNHKERYGNQNGTSWIKKES